MSTRAQIKIMETYMPEGGSKLREHSLLFYRHSDGYPDGALPTLVQFLKLVVKGVIRDNVEQSAGWLIAIGIEEYSTTSRIRDALGSLLPGFSPKVAKDISSWKVGSYEPACAMQGDIEFYYEIDLTKKEIRVFKTDYTGSNYETMVQNKIQIITAKKLNSYKD